jgi:hypothetical protein
MDSIVVIVVDITMVETIVVNTIMVSIVMVDMMFKHWISMYQKPKYLNN